MALKIYHDLEQGTDEWINARCGVLTASVIGQLLTDTGKTARNDKSRALVYELMAQRINKVVDEKPTTFAMSRGHEDEIEAKVIYSAKSAPITDVGFMTEDKWGVTIGYSPDGLVGDDGLIECKSKAQSHMMQAIIGQNIPKEHMAQAQCGLMVSGRQWLDFIGYPALGGGKMMVLRVFPDPKMQELLLDAAFAFEKELNERRAEYEEAIANQSIRYFDTERRQELEIMI